LIYHVTTEAQWKVFEEKDQYYPEAFLKEGFIHACHAGQLQGVLERYFAGLTDLVVLYIDESRLTSQLKHEPATGGEHFPHIYGSINKESVVSAEPLSEYWRTIQ
jgi:uncharacterized protein (DUF952 family)